MMDIESIPSDILAKILSFVDLDDALSVICVCKRWKNLYLEKSCQPWANNGRGLLFSCEKGFVEYYRKWSAIAGDRWRTKTALKQQAFCSACCNGRASVVEELLKDKSIYPSARNDFGLRSACLADWSDVVKLLLDSYEPSKEGLTKAVYWATMNKHKDVVRVLLDDRRVQEKLTLDLKMKALQLLN